MSVLPGSTLFPIGDAPELTARQVPQVRERYRPAPAPLFDSPDGDPLDGTRDTAGGGAGYVSRTPGGRCVYAPAGVFRWARPGARQSLQRPCARHAQTEAAVYWSAAAMLPKTPAQCGIGLRDCLHFSSIHHESAECKTKSIAFPMKCSQVPGRACCAGRLCRLSRGCFMRVVCGFRAGFPRARSLQNRAPRPQTGPVPPGDTSWAPTKSTDEDR